MDDFIRLNVDKLIEFKKIFTRNTAIEFLTKLCKRGDIQKMESELNKCILTSVALADIDERKKFIINFINNYKKINNEEPLSKNFISLKPQDNKIGLGDILSNNGKIDLAKPSKIDIDDNQLSKIQIEDNSKKKSKKEEFRFGKKFRIDKLEKELPGIANIEVANYSKKYEFQEHHLKHKIEPNIKVCFCMGTKHPIVANCSDCGRIHCLQEGEDSCIECKSHLFTKNEFLKKCINDENLKKCHDHKEKLLKFQKEFYSKMNIIDDYTDWYEISNNTWISKEMRDIAKEKDEELEKIKDDMDYRITINLKTNEINRVYDEIDEAKVKQDISDFFVNSIREQKNESLNGPSKNKKTAQKVYSEIKDNDTSCAGFTEKAALEYMKFLKEKGLGYAKK